MRLFLDANILVSVINKEYPLFQYSSRILSLQDHSKFQLFTSPLCLAIAFYFASKKYNAASAKQRISIIAKHINVVAINSNAVKRALDNPAVLDLEDGMEYYSAVDAECDCIITEDLNDFHFSHIEVLNSSDFFLRYLPPNK